MIAGTLEVQMLANMARLQQDMDKGVGIVSNATAKMESAVKAAKLVLASLGAGLSVGYFVNLIKGSIDAMDNLRDLSKTTNLTVETLAGLKLAAKQSGGDLEGIAGSINKLAQNMGKDAEKFKMLGVSAKDPLEAFKQLSDVFLKIEDPQKRAAVMAEALGKSWQSAAPLLSEGSTRIQEMVDKGTKLSGITKEATEQADAFNDQLAEMKTSSEAIGIAFATALLPALNRALTAFREAADEGSRLKGIWEAIRAFGKMDELQWNRRQMVETAEKIVELEGAMASARKENISGADREELANLKKRYDAHKAIVEEMDKQAKVAGGKPSSGPAPNVAGFLAGDQEAKKKKELADTLHRIKLIEEGRLEFAERRNEVEKVYMEAMAEIEKRREEEQKKMIASEEAAAIARHDIAQQAYIDQGQIALKKLQDDKAKLKEVNEFTLQAARNMQSSMGTFFFDYMEGRMSNLQQGFLSMINKMVAEALAAKLGAKLFGDFDKTNEVGGWAGSLLGKAMGLFGGGGGAPQIAGGEAALAASLSAYGIPAFANGTPSVPRTGLALVHEGEEIIPAGKSRSMTVQNNFTIHGQADHRTQAQIAAAAGVGVQRAIARNT